VDKRFITDVFKESGVEISDKKNILSSFTRLPLTNDTTLLGVSLNKENIDGELSKVIIDKKDINHYIKYEQDNLNILSLIKEKNKNIIFTSDHIFYLKNALKPYYVLVVLNNESISYK